MLDPNGYQRLGRLLNALHLCMDIKFALMDENAREAYTSSFQTAFCRIIASTPGGYERCVACDAKALSDIQKTQKMKQYYCHAGLIEVALPVMEHGERIASILFGQMLDNTSRDEQWQRVSKACAWHPNVEELYQPFLRLKRISQQQINACTEIVHACVSEVRLSGIVASNDQGDMQRLINYLDTHYDGKISVESVCNALSIGKTRLYQLCKSWHGKTIVDMVNARRIEAAKELLITTSQSIQFIADTVGIPDYNYFTKVFKKAEGITPSAYRKIYNGNSAGLEG